MRDLDHPSRLDADPFFDSVDHGCQCSTLFRPPHRDLPWSLHLSRGTLGAGDYRVRFFGLDGPRKVPIEEYALRVLP
jgi:hypothetical protein